MVIALISKTVFSDQKSQATSNENAWTKYWLTRGWEYRYWLEFVEGKWDAFQKGAAKQNSDEDKEPNKNKTITSYSVSEILLPTYTVSLFGNKDPSNLLVVEFNKTSTVISKHTNKRPLQGRLASISASSNMLLLSEGNFENDRQYRLSDWFHGYGDASVNWAPAFCSYQDMGGSSPNTNDYYKYGPKFKPDNPPQPIFGCREWGYQLYDDSRPYIDVTSYTKKTKSHPHGTYIRDFTGWGRIGDKKPVIGKDADTWYCLYDCPNDEAPGPISDIKAWTVRFGWHVPKPPTKAPTFPDSPARQGDYTN